MIEGGKTLASTSSQLSLDDAPTERDKVALFIGRNADYYLKVYDALLPETAQARKYTSFNLSVLLVAPLWLLYRKLYLWASAFWSGFYIFNQAYDLLLNEFLLSLLWSPGALVALDFGLNIIVVLFCATRFDVYYIQKARRTVLSIDQQALSDGMKLKLIKEKGGTSPASVFVAVIALVAIGAALS